MPVERWLGLLLASSWFLEFKQIELHGGAICFSDLLKDFHDFCSQSGKIILATPRKAVELKSDWSLRREFFISNFKLE